MLGRRILSTLFCVLAMSMNVRADDVDVFMAELGLTNAPPRTGACLWTPPRQIDVEGGALQLERCWTNRTDCFFALNATGGAVVANCRVGTASTPLQAERRLCEILTFCISMPISDFAHEFEALRVDSGDLVILDRHDVGEACPGKTRYFRTRGNLFVTIKCNPGHARFSAREIASGLLSAGVAPL